MECGGGIRYCFEVKLFPQVSSNFKFDDPKSALPLPACASGEPPAPGWGGAVPILCKNKLKPSPCLALLALGYGIWAGKKRVSNLSLTGKRCVGPRGARRASRVGCPRDLITKVGLGKN